VCPIFFIIFAIFYQATKSGADQSQPDLQLGKRTGPSGRHRNVRSPHHCYQVLNLALALLDSIDNFRLHVLKELAIVFWQVIEDSGNLHAISKVTDEAGSAKSKSATMGPLTGLRAQNSSL
jgi:hypothetical protein